MIRKLRILGLKTPTQMINPDFLSLCGSRLYGVANPDSDVERRGFVLSSLHYWSGLPGYNFQQQEIKRGDEDTLVWNLRDYIKHLINGNTQSFEILFSDEYIATPLGEEVLSKRDWFVSKHIYRSIRGFAYGEFSRITGEEIKAKPEYVDDWEKINNFCSGFQLKGHERESIVEMIEYVKNAKLTTRVKHTKQGDKRKVLFEKYGFDTKAAYHSVRLLSQGIEILTTGKFTFPRPEANLLIDIRQGKKTLPEVVEIFNTLQIELDAAFAKSELPERPDIKQINSWYVDLLSRNRDRLYDNSRIIEVSQ